MGKPRVAATAAILRVANERAVNNIAPIIAKLQAGGRAFPCCNYLVTVQPQD